MKRVLLSFAVLICGVIAGHAQSAPDTYIRSNSEQAVKVSTDVGVVALPALALGAVLFEHDWEGFVQGLEAGGATIATTLILKYVIKEQRPDFSNMHSFPSGHSSVSFASAAFLQRRYGWKIGAPAYAVASYVGWGRVYAKKHHWWDVVAGAGIGVASSYIFTKPFAQKHELSISPISAEGTPGLTCQFSF